MLLLLISKYAVELVPLPMFFFPLLTDVIKENRELVPKIAPIQIPNHRPLLFSHHLARGEVVVNHRLVACEGEG